MATEELPVVADIQFRLSEYGIANEPAGRVLALVRELAEEITGRPGVWLPFGINLPYPQMAAAYGPLFSQLPTLTIVSRGIADTPPILESVCEKDFHTYLDSLPYLFGNATAGRQSEWLAKAFVNGWLEGEVIRKLGWRSDNPLWCFLRLNCIALLERAVYALLTENLELGAMFVPAARSLGTIAPLGFSKGGSELILVCGNPP